MLWCLQTELQCHCIHYFPDNECRRADLNNRIRRNNKPMTQEENYVHTSSCCYVTYSPYHLCHWMETVNWDRFIDRWKKKKKSERDSAQQLNIMAPIEQFWWENLIFTQSRSVVYSPTQSASAFPRIESVVDGDGCTAHALRMELEKFTFQWHNCTFDFPPAKFLFCSYWIDDFTLRLHWYYFRMALKQLQKQQSIWFRNFIIP